VSQPGKIGGSQGTAVVKGDVVLCVVTSAAGAQAAVGSNWMVLTGKVAILGYVQWRLNITANDGDGSYTSLDRIQLFVGATNVVLTAVSFAASSANGGDGPSNVVAVDSNAWITAAGAATPSSITITLAAAADMTSYSLTSQHVVTGRTPSAWTLQGSNDGTTWTTVDSRTGITGWGIQETRSFTIT
jgi:hypothetical protein